MSQKLLTVIGFILFLIIIAEGLYLYLRNPTYTSITTNSPTEEIKKDINIPFKDRILTPTPINSQYAHNREQLEWYKYTLKNGHVYTKVHQRFQGEIDQIRTQDFKKTETGEIITAYEIFLTSSGITDESTMNSFLITENLLQLAIIKDINGTSINITDLKVGDPITISIITDLSRQFGFGYELFEIVRNI